MMPAMRYVSLVEMNTPLPQAPNVKKARDLRLDFFRGLALIFIFLDHMPAEVLGRVTLGHFGFSDAAEMFVFISGYSAALAFGSKLPRDGFGFTAIRVLRRCWQLYVAHIFLFVVFSAEVSYVADRFQNPMFTEEMNVAGLIDLPHVALMQALLLKFRPTYMDILPLYIALLLPFPLVLLGLSRAWWLTLGASAGLWWATGVLDWSLPSYPEGTVWFFNPLAWQFLFILGAAIGSRRDMVSWLWRPSAWLGPLPLALAYLVFAMVMAVGISWPTLEHYLPEILERLFFPLDKTNLVPARLLHFLCLAYAVTYFIRPDNRMLRWRIAHPLVICGRHSLEVFCIGTFLAFAGHFLSVEVLPGWEWDLALSLAGIGLMLGVARLLNWYQAAEQMLYERGKWG